MRITKREKAHVPWLELARTPTKYLDVNTIPEGFKVLDPSKLTKNRVFDLWCHWSDRAKANLPILVFIKAREQDLGVRARYNLEKPSVSKKRMAVNVASDDETGNDKLDGPADKGEGTSGSPHRQPPSKRPRLSLSPWPVVSEEQSPAANNSNRQKFLYGLCNHPSYKTLIDGVLALPVSVSSFFSSYIWFCLITLIHEASSSSLLPNRALPVWASWGWDKKYLSEDIHTRMPQFNVGLKSLQEYTFVDCDEGTSVVLGLGLLWRECWRAVKVEGDDEDFPKFLRESLLGSKRAERVAQAIKEMADRLPQPDTDKERLQKKKLDGSTKAQKTKAGLEKPTRKKHPHIPSPGPSPSKKLSDTQKEDNSPVRNIRSQRERKPTKKLQGIE